MSAEDEVTRWLAQLGGGDPGAAQALWENYFAKLVRFARRKLRDVPHRTFDEEDVALSALFSFCRGMEEGRFDQLADRDELWKLLITITARKICAQQRHALRSKRGGGHVRGESVFCRADGREEAEAGIADVLGSEPTPELANMLVENTQQLLDSLQDESLAQIARMKLEGWPNDEIARELGCVRRTVERKIERIREKWAKRGLA
jgi:DNA-directed RNA polymerase specialized sigma24 family protein